MFFGAVENFQRALLQTHSDPKILILRLHRVPFMDITGIQTVEEVIANLRKRNVRVVLCEANDRVLGKLRKAGVLDALLPGDYCGTFNEALTRAAPVQAQSPG